MYDKYDQEYFDELERQRKRSRRFSILARGMLILALLSALATKIGWLPL
ncbi:hypothetical protein [Rhizobium phage RHEph12]|nr:hypothetical protein [Rhizobium phage RHEph12]